MPGMGGAAFLEQARELNPQALRIILSGEHDLPATMEAINRGGASLYIAKPWDEQQLHPHRARGGRQVPPAPGK